MFFQEVVNISVPTSVILTRLYILMALVWTLAILLINIEKLSTGTSVIIHALQAGIYIGTALVFLLALPLSPTFPEIARDTANTLAHQTNICTITKHAKIPVSSHSESELRRIESSVTIPAQPPNSFIGTAVVSLPVLLLLRLRLMEAKSSVIMAVIIHSIFTSMEVA